MGVVLRLVGALGGALGQCLVGVFRDRDAVGEFERGLEAVGEARGDVAAHDDPVDDDVDVVLVLLVELRRIGDLGELAVELNALEALLHQLGKLLAELALAPLDDGREQVEARALRLLEDAVDHLGDGLALDRQAGGGRVGHADAREQQAQVVVDLGDGADGGARVAAGRLLLDRDRRREPVDVVDVGLLHHLEELARVGRQALDVAPLSLRIDRIEGERRLAGTGKPGEHDERIARDRQVDVLEVVLARAAHGDGLGIVAHDVVVSLFSAPGRLRGGPVRPLLFLTHDHRPARVRVNACP